MHFECIYPIKPTLNQIGCTVAVLELSFVYKHLNHFYALLANITVCKSFICYSSVYLFFFS